MKNNNKNIMKRKITPQMAFFLFLGVVIGIPVVIFAPYLFDKLVYPPTLVDLMMYFGATIGGLATLMAVYIAIDKEKEIRESERKIDARVFITMNHYIKFRDYNGFCEYAKNANVSKFYHFPDWFSGKENELFWITEPENKDPKRPYRFNAFIVVNSTDKPVFNIRINVNVALDNDGVDDDQYGLKSYKPINFKVLSQQSKVAFAIPVIGKKEPYIKNIDIKYETMVGEQMCYKYDFSYSSKDQRESYCVDGKKIHDFDIKPTTFHDLNKVDYY